MQQVNEENLLYERWKLYSDSLYRVLLFQGSKGKKTHY